MPQEMVTLILVFSTNNSEKEAKIEPEQAERGGSFIDQESRNKIKKIYEGGI